MARCSKCDHFHTDDMRFVRGLCRRCVGKELDRLQAIVAQLRKCWTLRDGVLVQDKPVVDGMRLFLVADDGEIVSWEHGHGYVEDCCDSQEAAEAAEEKPNAP